MSLDNNSIKIDDNQIENLDSNNQNSSFSKKKLILILLLNPIMLIKIL